MIPLHEFHIDPVPPQWAAGRGVTMTAIRRWVLPVLLAIMVMFAYQWWLSPLIEDVRADWQFLHAARIQTIQQMQQRAQQQAPKP